MKLTDEQQRLATAAMLLAAYKRIGGSARRAANHLGVSPSRLSYWMAVKSTHGRNVGLPTEEQMDKLVELLRLQMAQNLIVLTALVSGEGLARFKERYLLLKETKFLEEVTRTWRKQYDKDEALLVELRSLGQKHGVMVGGMIKSEYSLADLDALENEKSLVDAADPIANIHAFHKRIVEGSGEGKSVADSQGTREMEEIYWRVMELLAEKERKTAKRLPKKK